MLSPQIACRRLLQLLQMLCSSSSTNRCRCSAYPSCFIQSIPTHWTSCVHTTTCVLCHQPSSRYLALHMLSTRHALKEWDSVRELLADIQAYAAVHPGQSLPANLNHCSQRVRLSMAAFSRALASPLATWQQLLEKEVICLLWWCIGVILLSKWDIQLVCCWKPTEEPHFQGQSRCHSLWPKAVTL
jgi:hypothetical protein